MTDPMQPGRVPHPTRYGANPRTHDGLGLRSSGRRAP